MILTPTAAAAVDTTPGLVNGGHVMRTARAGPPPDGNVRVGPALPGHHASEGSGSDTAPACVRRQGRTATGPDCVLMRTSRLCVRRRKWTQLQHAHPSQTDSDPHSTSLALGGSIEWARYLAGPAAKLESGLAI